jgi:lipopolysaccharide export system permease protein
MSPVSARPADRVARSGPSSARAAAPVFPDRRPRRRGRRRGFPLTASLYLMAEILRIFAIALFAIALVYITVIGFQLVRDGIRLDYVWGHVLRTIAYPLFFSVPLAFLFGITLGLGRLAADQELSALRVNGVSHRQIWTPVVVLALSLGGLSFYLAGWLLPEVHYEQANLRRTILAQLDDLGSGTNRTILLPGDVSLWVQRYDGPRLKGIVLDIQKGDRAQILPEIGALAGEAIRQRLAAGQLAGKVTLAAREADIDVSPDRNRVILSLRGVEIQMPELVSGPRGLGVVHQVYTIERLPLPLSFPRRGESAKDLPNHELLRWIRTLKDQGRSLEEEIRTAGPLLATMGRPGPSGALVEEALDAGGPALAMQALGREVVSIRKTIARAECELHGRFTFSLACLTFPLVALPIVVLLERRGRLTHFFLANIAVVVIFFPLVMAGNLAADRGWPPAIAMAFPNVVLAALGIPLLRAMGRR